MLRRTIPSIFIIMALVFLFSCSGSADKPDVAVESITLDSTEITLKAGETATLNATVSPEDATDKSLLWESDSESITVEAGVVTVSSTATAGEYTITVSSVSNTTVKATCTVTVEAATAGGGGGGSAPSYSKVETITVEDSLAETPKEYSINAETLVTLSGLEKGEVYTVLPKGATPNAKGMYHKSAGTAVRATADSRLISTNGGTYIIYADSTSFQFGGDELGDGVSSFELAKLEPDPINLGDDMVIQRGVDECLFKNDEGQMVYEKVYEVNLAGADALGLNLSDIVVYTVRSGSGRNISTDYGIVSENGMDRAWGVLDDLSGKDTVTVFQQIRIGEGSSDNYKFEVRIDNPVDLNEEGMEIVNSPAIYRIKPESLAGISEDLVLELTLGENRSPNDYLLTANIMNPRSAKDGSWKEHCLIPLRYYSDASDSKEKVAYYLGRIDEDVIFNFDMVDEKETEPDKGSMVIRAINDEDKNHMIEVDINNGLSDSYEINLSEYKDILNPDGDFISLVFKGAEEARTGLTVKADGLSNSIWMHIVGGPVDKIGYSQYSLPQSKEPFDEISFSDRRYLDRATIHINIKDWNVEELGTINLTISK